ncbi:MAG TPA: DUF3857 and transglutaminase domain-containing protein [Thermoanaerobaculia bacterium]|nr:DUF3857 and transglutaminase domain-containing protein [Thermoanaerobaculia bacterium]
MACPRLRLPLLAAILLLAPLPAGALAAAVNFPEIRESERLLTSVPGHPNAPSVVLFKKGRFSVMNSGRYDPRFVVQVRRKILTEEGKKYGEVSVFHSKQVKLQKLEGRTVLPDGREIPLPKDATFKRRISKAEKVFITSIAFPAVEVGAILDYRYEIRLPSIFLLEPWNFQEDVPTLDSDIVYDVPEDLLIRTALLDPLLTGVRQQTIKDPFSWRVQAWGKNLPPLPDEPHSVPRADLASRFLMIPVEVVASRGGKNTELLKTWASTCELFAPGYEKASRKAGTAAGKAREIAAAVPGGPREKAQAVYRFVRDQIETVENYGVWLPEDSTVDAILAVRRGDYSEKALLLKSMLGALQIPSRLVWVGERDGGKIRLEFTTPWWFDRMIVAADLDGQRVFLDPSDRSLAFGRLAPDLEGMQALLFDRANPETLTLPSSPFEENLRKATVDFDLDAQGRLSGRGSLLLTGHHAWTYLDWKENAEETAKAWKEWVAGKYTDFDVTDVKVTEAVEETRVEVAWSMAQREDEVLGDEATVHLSRPLGPVKQPFVSPAADRVSPIFFDFADRDETEVTLRWPEGWSPETLPDDKDVVSGVGVFKAGLDLDTAGRRATFHRRFDIKDRELDKKLYNSIQSLFGQAEKSDAQVFVLVKR